MNSGLPPALALWLIGLGIAVRWIPPGRPQENGKVERTNGVAQQWAEPSACTSRAQLQARLDHEATIQRERYPSIGGRSRAEAFPGLGHSGRTYRRVEERGMWDLAHVDRFLSGLTRYRRANARGAIWLYNAGRGLGRVHRGKEVCIGFEASSRAWIVHDLDGQELKRFPAEELSRGRILALRVGTIRKR